jgi:hypothetical protein
MRVRRQPVTGWNDDVDILAPTIQVTPHQVQRQIDETTRELTDVVGMGGSISRAYSGGVQIRTGAGMEAVSGGVRRTQVEPDGDLFIGYDIDDPAGVSFAVFVNAQEYNTEDMEEGDLLIGDNSPDQSNVKWDASEGQFQFRAGTTVKSYMDTDGSLVVTLAEIGGFVVDGDSITADTGAVGLSSNTDEAFGDNIRFWAGDATAFNAPFLVTDSGYLQATDVNISGVITAISGEIGGWSISATKLESGHPGIVLDSANQVIKVGSWSGGNHIQIDGVNQRIRNSTFSSGASGFNIDTSTGDAEFNNLTARGELKTFLLTSSNQMAVAGNIIVSKDAGKLGADVTAIATTVNFGKALTVGDWIKIQGPDATGSNALEAMLVGSLVSGTTYNVTRNVDGSGANAWLKDTPFVVIGSNGTSRIELTAGASGSIQLITQGAAYGTTTVQASMSTVAGAITAGGGDVVLNSSGIQIANGATAVFSFEDVSGTHGNIVIGSDAANDLSIVNYARTPSGTISFFIKDTAGNNRRPLRILEDPANANVLQVDISPGSTSSKLSMGGEVVIWAQKDGVETVFNDGSYDIDERHEGATDANLFRLDGGLDAAAFGGAPASGVKLKVYGDLQVTGTLNAVSNWITVSKTIDEAVQNNTIQSDDALTFSMAANKKYRIRGRIWYTTPGAADFKYRFNYGSGSAPTINYLKHKYVAPLAAAETEQAVDVANPTATISVLSAGTINDPGYIEFDAIVHKENATHNFTFQWAQVTTTATNTTVKAGSYIEYQEM